MVVDVEAETTMPWYLYVCGYKTTASWSIRRHGDTEVDTIFAVSK